MFKKVIKDIFAIKSKPSKTKGENSSHPVSANLETVKAEVRKVLGNSTDLILRELLIANGARPALLVFLENMVDLDIINEAIIGKLQIAPKESLDNADKLANSALATSKVTVTDNLASALQQVLYGNSVIFVDGFNQALVTETIGYQNRNIMPPQTEPNIEGPNDGLVESLKINLTLIRRRLVDKDLRFEQFTVGTRSNTLVVVGYLAGVADPSIVAEVKRRLKAIKIDAVQGTETIIEYFFDNPLSLFPLVLKTERPDNVVSCLLEGRVVVIVDGYPFAITVPTTFAEFMQAGDDYYQNFYFATFTRILRYFTFVATLILPSFYIALVTHHWEMLPTALALTIAGSREGVPFPVVLEVFFMEVTFEILREAGVRLPRAVGQAVSIVGALVLGQSAVQAGLVSPSVVIVVAFTGIASFSIPKYNATVPLRLLRFPLMFITALFGLPGLVAATLAIWGYMAGLTSFGVPYLAPLTPMQGKDFKDTVYRLPRWAMVNRPQSVPSMDSKRVKPFIPPGGGDQDE
ncbi:spore germination protein [Peptococcaceae bacterium 1198_IL3148]